MRGEPAGARYFGPTKDGNPDMFDQAHSLQSRSVKLGSDRRRPRVSFEFFPPKDDKMADQLWAAAVRLAPLQPHYVSVTYGAGGSTRERTHATVKRLQDELGLTAAAHITCVAATREEVDTVAADYWASGIRHVVALRGDPPEGESRYRPHPGGYPFAADLVAGLRDVADFEIAVAAYPEVHPEAPTPEADLDNLRRKLEAGATHAITQYFFDNDHYYRFVERARRAGITAPIIPGIMPVTNFRQITRFSSMCGASVPAWMAERFDSLEDDPETRRLVGASIAVEQCNDLWDNGVEEFHFYTLNRADLTYAICHILGVRPESESAGQSKAAVS